MSGAIAAAPAAAAAAAPAAQEKRARVVPRADTIEFLNCPVCKTYIRGNVFQCKNNHHACEKCSTKLKQCHTCRVPCGWTRLRAVEELRNELLMRCSAEACDVECHGLEELIAHESLCPHSSRCDVCNELAGEHTSKCPHRRFRCPFRAHDVSLLIGPPCEEHVTLASIGRHFDAAHGLTPLVELAPHYAHTIVLTQPDSDEYTYRQYYVVGDTIAVMQMEQDDATTHLELMLLSGPSRDYSMNLTIEKEYGFKFMASGSGRLMAPIGVYGIGISLAGSTWQQSSGFPHPAILTVRIGDVNAHGAVIELD